MSGTGFTRLPLQCWQRGALVPSGPYRDPGDQSLSVRLPLQVQVACSADAHSNTLSARHTDMHRRAHA